MKLVIPLLFAHAIALGGGAALAQSPIEAVRFNQVDLQAEVSRDVQNDLMGASLYADVTDASAAQVASQLNRLANDALKTAAEYKSVRARSGYNQTYPVYDRNNKQTGWRGRAEIRLESKDVQAMGDLIGKLQSSMQLGGVRFSVSPELRRQVENELMTEAVAAFRARSDIARQALGGRSYKIRRVGLNTGGFTPPPGPVARAMAPAAADAVVAPNFEAGWTTIQVGASGTIEVE